MPFVLALLGGTAACSSGARDTETPGAGDAAVDEASAPAADGAVEAGSISCARDPRVESYYPGIQTVGSGGSLTFILVSADPSPPTRGVTAWTVEVRDSSGQIVPSPSYTLVRPWMPDHGHGPSLRPTVTPNADGTVTIGDLDFFMTGVWQVTLQVQADASSDTGVFTFCID